MVKQVIFDANISKKNLPDLKHHPTADTMKYLALVVTTLTVLVGCVVPPLIIQPKSSDERVRSEFFEPSVGVAAKREVGESLLRKGISTVTKSSIVTLLDEASSTMDLGHKLYLVAGASGPLLRRSDNGLHMVCARSSGALVACLVDTDKDGLFDQSMFASRDKYFPLAAPVRYKIASSERVVEDPADFHVDVLYQGLTKGDVKISFREFKGGIARPAFTQDVSYELEKDGTAIIAFKGMRIKVLKATSSDISYIVEKPPTS